MEFLIFVLLVFGVIFGVSALDCWHRRYAWRAASQRAHEIVYGMDRSKWPKQ